MIFEGRGHQRAETLDLFKAKRVHLITPLEGHPRGYLTTFSLQEGYLGGTLPCFLHEKCTLNGSLPRFFPLGGHPKEHFIMFYQP